MSAAGRPFLHRRESAGSSIVRDRRNDTPFHMTRLTSITSHQSLPIQRLIFIFLIWLVAPAGAQNGRPSSPSPPESAPDPYGFDGRFNPSMAIIIVVLISAFFFMGFFSIYLRQCGAESRSLRGRSVAGVRGLSRRAARGLDPAVIEKLPTFEYAAVKNLKLGKGALECAVCLCEFDEAETLRLLPICSHVFHPDCIDTWLTSHTTCPVCRSDLIDPDPDSASTATDAAAVADSDDDSEVDQHQVSITIDQDPTVPLAAPTRPPPPPDHGRRLNRIQSALNCPAGSKSSRRQPRKFPRSHSTGHSLVQPGENVERFTLRLPEHIMVELVQGRMNRTGSCHVSGDQSAQEGSGRRGHRGGGEGSSRGWIFGRSDRVAKSDRWVFSMTPPFFSRTLSVKSPAKRGSVKSTPSERLAANPEPETGPSGSSRRSTTPVFSVATQP